MMKIRLSCLILLLSLCAHVASAGEVELFNHDWRFARYGQMPDGSALAEPDGLEANALDDSGKPP